MEPRLLEDIRAHREVREPVAAGIRAVRADAPDLGREVEHELGLGVAEHPRGVVHRREVVVGAAGDDDLVAVGLEALDEVRSEESSAAGDEHAHRCRLQVASGTGAADAGLAGCPIRLDAWPAPRSPSVSKCGGADSAYRNCRRRPRLSFCSPSSPSTTRSRTPRSAGTTRRSTSSYARDLVDDGVLPPNGVGAYYTPAGVHGDRWAHGQSRQGARPRRTRTISASS